MFTCDGGVPFYFTIFDLCDFNEITPALLLHCSCTAPAQVRNVATTLFFLQEKYKEISSLFCKREKSVPLPKLH